MYSVTRQQIVDAALECRNVRFRHQGRSKATGVDCVGLLAVVLEAVNYPEIHDVEGYKKCPPSELIRSTLEKNFDTISVDEVGPGDIYLMKIGAGAEPQHASILLNDDTDVEKGIEPMIIHAYALGSHGRVVVEPRLQWFHKCVLGFRLRGLCHR